MSQYPTDPVPSMTSDFQLSGEPPAWPKVVGIISIVWASLLLVCNMCGVLGGLFQGAFVNMMPPEQQEQMKQQLAASQSPASLAVYAIGLLLSVLLLTAGIMTVRRKAAGRMLHLLWAAGGVLLTVVSIMVQWGVMQQQLQQTQSSAKGVNPAAMQGGMYIGLVVGVCIGLAYPIFCLVWFGVMGKRPETGAVLQEPLV